VCDSTSVATTDLIECDLVYEEYEGEHFKVKFNRNHSWHYLEGQRNDEVILIQNYDSTSQTRKGSGTVIVEPMGVDQACQVVHILLLSTRGRLMERLRGAAWRLGL